MPKIELRARLPKDPGVNINPIKKHFIDCLIDRLKWTIHCAIESASQVKTFDVDKNSHVSIRDHLSGIEHLFSNSCKEALKDQSVDALLEKFNNVENELAGVVYEGAAMGYSILDALSSAKTSRWHRLSALASDKHPFALHAGLGMAIARMKAHCDQRFLDSVNPIYRQVVIDGYGFFLGYSDSKKYIDDRFLPEPFSRQRSGAFDQGLGRSLWFRERGNVRKIKSIIMRFAEHRRANLWIGIGIACTYSGGVGTKRIVRLKNAAGVYKSQLARGAALAALVRVQAGNMTMHTDACCQILAGEPADKLAEAMKASLAESRCRSGVIS